MKDLHSKIKVIRAIPPVAIGTTGIAGGQLSPAIDRKGYSSVEYAIAMGLAGASGDTTNVVVYESDSATAASFTSVADADLLGTEALAGKAVAALTSGVGINIVGKIGYRGNKRYTKIRLYGLGHATGLVSALAILSDPEVAPVA